jgi:DNA-binding NtrC family response regulator
MAAAKVLVVDDEAMIRWSIEQTLRSAECEVTGAETAAEGFALVRRLHPDVVFLDVRLPDEDGFALLRKIKAESGPATTVVMMTALDDPGKAAEALRLGATAYLRKPFDFGTLPAIVRSAVKSGREAGPVD